MKEPKKVHLNYKGIYAMNVLRKIDLSEQLGPIGSPARFDSYRQLWNHAASREIITSFPLHVDIELSGICNLRCSNCFQNGLINGKLGLMNYDLFTKIIDEGVSSGLCAIKLQVRGESLLSPILVDCIKYAKKSGILDIHLTTNAILLDESIGKEIILSGLDFIIFSIDAHHEQSVIERYKISYSDIENRVNNFLRLRKSMKASFPKVRIQASTYDDTPDKLALVEKKLRDRFPLADIYVAAQLHCFDYYRKGYTGESRFTLLPCHYLFQRLAIYWDGRVTVCCMDYNALFNLGNLEEHTIREIWHGPALQGLRHRHLIGLRSQIPICNRCIVALERTKTPAKHNHHELHYHEYSKLSQKDVS